MYPGRHNQAPPGQLGGGGPARPPGQGALGLAPPGQGALGLGQAPPGQGALGLGQAPPGPIGGILGHALPTFGGQGGNGSGKKEIFSVFIKLSKYLVIMLMIIDSFFISRRRVLWGAGRLGRR